MRRDLVMAVALAAAMATGCEGDGSEGKAGGALEGPLYAMMVQVYGPTDRTVYVSLSDSVDIDSTRLEVAREFPGVANFAAIGGKLLISDGTRPSITEYEITSDYQWRERRSVSFASYPLSDNANFFYHFIVDETRALFPYDGTKRIHWNPSEMAIVSSLEASSLVGVEPGLTLAPGGNRNGVQYDGPYVLQAFYYHDDDWYKFGGRSHVVAYDSTTFAEVKVLDIPCPNLSIATRDEEGITYFGNWGLPKPSLIGEAPAPCLATVSPSLEVKTADLREWTEGRFVNNFRYIGGGRAVGNVLHPEALGVTRLDELSAEELGDIGRSGAHWRLWLFDVVGATGHPVDGVDVPMGSGSQFAVFGDRTFFFVPYDDWGRTKIYELVEGSAVERVDTVGDVFKWIRVR